MLLLQDCVLLQGDWPPYGACCSCRRAHITETCGMCWFCRVASFCLLLEIVCKPCEEYAPGCASVGGCPCRKFQDTQCIRPGALKRSSMMCWVLVQISSASCITQTCNTPQITPDTPDKIITMPHALEQCNFTSCSAILLQYAALLCVGACHNAVLAACCVLKLLFVWGPDCMCATPFVQTVMNHTRC